MSKHGTVGLDTFAFNVFVGEANGCGVLVRRKWIELLSPMSERCLIEEMAGRTAELFFVASKCLAST